MIDFHCHYLPCIDDGAQSVAEALELARASVADGIKHAVLTPHVHPGRYENTLSGLKPRFEAFRRVLEFHKIPLTVHLGGEVRFGPEALQLLAEEELPSPGSWEGGRVVLFEFPPGQIPVGSIKAMGPLRSAGVVPLIAHPERNKDVMRDWRRIEPFVQEGCLLQITAASLCGNFGAAAKKTAEQLMDAGWVSIVATDAHNLEHRPPMMTQARRVIAERYGMPSAQLLTEFNPARILVGDAVAREATEVPVPPRSPSADVARAR